MVNKEHNTFKCESVGLIISTTHLYLAASPDRIFTCTCHGRGVVEVKCPFVVKGLNIKEHARQTKGFCLLYNETTTKLFLDLKHEYYSQVYRR